MHVFIQNILHTKLKVMITTQMNVNEISIDRSEKNGQQWTWWVFNPLYYIRFIFKCNISTLFYGPAGLSRCTNLGVSRAAPPCASSSAHDQRRAGVGQIAMRHQGIENNFKVCIEIVCRCFVAKNHRRYIAEQRRAAHNSRRTFDKVGLHRV